VFVTFQNDIFIPMFILYYRLNWKYFILWCSCYS